MLLHKILIIASVGWFSFFFFHPSSAPNNFSFVPFLATCFKTYRLVWIIFEPMEGFWNFLQHNKVVLLILCSLSQEVV